MDKKVQRTLGGKEVSGGDLSLSVAKTREGIEKGERAQEGRGEGKTTGATKGSWVKQRFVEGKPVTGERCGYGVFLEKGVNRGL